MAEPISAAPAVAPIPSSDDIARAEKLVRERFVHPGEDPSVALAPGSPRRRALDQALAELAADPKTKHPSTSWRRHFSLLLGLERLLSEEEPKLADGTELSAHQVDALSGTLAALLAEAERTSSPGNGRAAASASPELLASADILGPDDAANGSEPNGGVAVQEAQDVEEDEDEEEPEEDDFLDEDDEELGPVQRAVPEEDEEDEEEDEEDEEED